VDTNRQKIREYETPCEIRLVRAAPVGRSHRRAFEGVEGPGGEEIAAALPRFVSASDDRFERWLHETEHRHLADLTFPQLSSGLRALSSTYVERRQRLGEGAALDGAGKRAAFALFYGPLHFLLVRAIVHALPGALQGTHETTLVDLGCGTGAAGAAWATACERPPRVAGIDRHPWAVGEAARTYRAFGLTARTVKGDIASVALPKGPTSILAAFALNELAEASRDALMQRLLERAAAGDRLLIVEPIAGFVARWWDRWGASIERMGGRADEWRFRLELPAIVAKLDRAAKLDHRELTARSLWISRSG
jgi:SAM-dependent methyltransferase